MQIPFMCMYFISLTTPIYSPVTTFTRKLTSKTYVTAINDLWYFPTLFIELYEILHFVLIIDFFDRWCNILLSKSWIRNDCFVEKETLMQKHRKIFYIAIISRVGWGCWIHWLHLCRRVRLLSHPSWLGLLNTLTASLQKGKTSISSQLAGAVEYTDCISAEG